MHRPLWSHVDDREQTLLLHGGGTPLPRAVTRGRTAVAVVGPVTAGTCEDVGLVVRMGWRGKGMMVISANPAVS